MHILVHRHCMFTFAWLLIVVCIRVYRYRSNTMTCAGEREQVNRSIVDPTSVTDIAWSTEIKGCS